MVSYLKKKKPERKAQIVYFPLKLKERVKEYAFRHKQEISEVVALAVERLPLTARNIPLLKSNSALTPACTTSRTGYVRTISHKIATLQNDFSLIPDCPSMHHDHSMKPNCGSVASQKRTYTCFKTPGKQCCSLIRRGYDAQRTVQVIVR